MVEAITGLEVRAELGRGSMGQVMLARRLPVGDLVAVKRLAEAATMDRAQRVRLQREAEALRRLDHPHVVQFLQLLEYGSDLLLVLEYVDGPSLAVLAAGGPLPTADALAVLGQIQGGLRHAHALGVIHRDVKASNVLVGSDGLCRLSDFGLARLDDIASSSAVMLTRPGTPLGTAPYMAPEAVAGDAGLDVRSDIYSLGVLAYELLVGRLPFPAELGTVALLQAHVSRPVPRPSEIAEGFPPGVEEALLWPLEKDRDRRPSTVAEFWEALGAASLRAWPSWPEDHDLTALVQSPVSEPVVPAAGPRSWWSFEAAELPWIPPKPPELARPRRSLSVALLTALGVALALGTFLVLRTLLG